MQELYRRTLRIECAPNALAGVAVKITDAETGALIDGAFKAVITLDAAEANQAEISYYETKENGAIAVGSDGEPIVHTEVVKNLELDITALERPKMDLGDGMSITALSNNVVGESYLSVHLIDVAAHLLMTPDQALALLAWLKVSEKDLQQAVEHHNRPLRRTLARVAGE